MSFLNVSEKNISSHNFETSHWIDSLVKYKKIVGELLEKNSETIDCSWENDDELTWNF